MSNKLSENHRAHSPETHEQVAQMGLGAKFRKALKIALAINAIGIGGGALVNSYTQSDPQPNRFKGGSAPTPIEKIEGHSNRDLALQNIIESSQIIEVDEKDIHLNVASLDE